MVSYPSMKGSNTDNYILRHIETLKLMRDNINDDNFREGVIDALPVYRNIKFKACKINKL